MIHTEQQHTMTLLQAIQSGLNSKVNALESKYMSILMNELGLVMVSYLE